MSLVVEHVTKRFSGITAVDDASLRVDENETVGLIGPNGAGKTTLFNCILGVLKPEEGTCSYRGTRLDGLPIHKRSRLGIARTFQRMELFATLTPREHLLVTARARATRGGIIRDLLGQGRPTAEEAERAQRIIDSVGLSDFADQPVEALSLGQGRLVELARAMMCNPSIILLDEPSSGLDRAETAAFAAVLHSLREEQKLSLLVVEHDLELVLDVSDRLYVLDFGRMIAEGDPDEVMADRRVREAYLGVAS
jgi:branched-chain amino acid transport system ATP-binding protein